MDRGIYTAASGGLLSAKRLDVVAQNIADVAANMERAIVFRRFQVTRIRVLTDGATGVPYASARFTRDQNSFQYRPRGFNAAA